MLNITDIVQTLKVLFKYCLCFVLGNQQVASNDCITDTTRYSVRHAGHLFSIEFESNGKHLSIGSSLHITVATIMSADQPTSSFCRSVATALMPLRRTF